MISLFIIQSKSEGKMCDLKPFNINRTKHDRDDKINRQGFYHNYQIYVQRPKKKMNMTQRENKQKLFLKAKWNFQM